MDSIGVYAEMQRKNVLNGLVEKTTIHNGKVVSSDLTTWKQTEDSLFVPAATYRAALGAGVDTTAFTPFDGLTMDSRYGEPELLYERYDSLGNLLLARERTGRPATFFWDKRGMNPTFIIKDAMNGEQTRPVAGSVNRTEEDHHTSVRQIIKSFTSGIAGPFSLTFTPDDPVTDVVITLDGDTLTVRGLILLDGTTAYQFWMHGSSLYLPAGEHEVRVTCMPAPIIDSGQLDLNSTPNRGHVLQNLPFSGTLEINYSAPGIVERTVTGRDVFFEDFESDDGGPEGYHSDRGHLGTYTVSLTDLNPYRNYILDYWRRTGAGHWEYVRTSFTGNAAIGGPGMTVDQVRVFPEDAEAESYTWDANGLLLSRTDGRGVTESYEFDGLGRLTVIRDNDGNIIEQYEYKYQNR